MPESTITDFGPQVPKDVVQAWRDYGTGFIGDGFFRMVDPARARAELTDKGPIPPDVAVLFTSAMGDVIAWKDDWYVLVLTRYSEVYPTQVPLSDLAILMGNEAARTEFWKHEPYPEAADRLGVPDFEDCLVYVPPLKPGETGNADFMEVGDVWQYLLQLRAANGIPKPVAILGPRPDSAK